MRSGVCSTPWRLRASARPVLTRCSAVILRRSVTDSLQVLDDSARPAGGPCTSKGLQRAFDGPCTCLRVRWFRFATVAGGGGAVRQRFRNRSKGVQGFEKGLAKAFPKDCGGGCRGGPSSRGANRWSRGRLPPITPITARAALAARRGRRVGRGAGVPAGALATLGRARSVRGRRAGS